MDRVVTVQPHDRVKKLPLTSFDSAALLKTIGLADGSGKIRASMRGKYDQVNEFLKVVKETVQPTDEPFTVVDCGCGKAYLTISLYFYLTEVLKFSNVKVIGIDRRSDVVAAAKKMAAQLDVADRVLFVEADLNEFQISDLKSQIDGSVTSQSNSRTIEQSNIRTLEQRLYGCFASCVRYGDGRGAGERRRVEGAVYSFRAVLSARTAKSHRSGAAGVRALPGNV